MQNPMSCELKRKTLMRLGNYANNHLGSQLSEQEQPSINFGCAEIKKML